MKRWISILLCILMVSTAFSALAWNTGEKYDSLDELPTPVRDELDTLNAGTLCYALRGNDTIFILSQQDDSTRLVTIFVQQDESYIYDYQSAALSASDGEEINIGCTEDDRLYVYYGSNTYYTFAPNNAGDWQLVTVHGTDTYACTAYYLRLLNDPGTPDEWLCTKSAYATLATFDPALFPGDFLQAVALADTTDCGLVNNPNPEDRLNLRTKPSISSVSKGKFYNGTPVQVLEDLGEWVKVSVSGLEGYMLKEYITFGEDMLNVQSAFPDLSLVEECYADGATIYLRADLDSDIGGVVNGDDINRYNFIILGAASDDWYYVICSNGLAGYMPVSDFYEGNG